ncbi:MAG: HIT family protein [Myxococcales bacterium]|nr:HIT family protein [Myxococcales bacterium]
MASIFTKIIRGELPGRFLWKDDRAVAFLTIEPLKPGHALVVPIAEVDHWIALEPDLAAHLMRVAQAVGQAQQRAFDPLRIGMMIVGVEVPHVHLHITPIDAIGDLNFAKAERNPDPAAMDAAAEKIRAELRALGHAEVADA